MPRKYKKKASPWVTKKKKSKNPRAKVQAVATGYFNDRDPYRTFATKAEARQEGTRLKGLLKKRSSRVVTFYGVLQDPRKGVPEKNFPTTKQGPHTIPHYYVLDALVNARGDDRLDELADLRLTPAKFKQIVDAEIPVGHIKRRRAEVAVELYKRVYKRAAPLLTKMKSQGLAALTEPEQIKLVHTINKAFQLHTYQTYSYKGKGASKKALAGKGERRGAEVTIDLPHTAGFQDTEATQTVLEELRDKFGGFQKTS